MASHGLVHQEARRVPDRRQPRNGLLRLGWPHFWLLSMILGGLLGVVVFALVAWSVSA